MKVEEDEVVDPKALRRVVPEEHYEGYTGNEGMTLDRWYRHAAIVLWPGKRHYAVLCDAGSRHATLELKQMVTRWRRAGRQTAPALRAECIAFAKAIITTWSDADTAYGWPHASVHWKREMSFEDLSGTRNDGSKVLLPSLAAWPSRS